MEPAQLATTPTMGGMCPRRPDGAPPGGTTGAATRGVSPGAFAGIRRFLTVVGLWAALVLIPVLLAGWLLHGLLEQYRSSQAQAISRSMERSSRNLLWTTDPRQMAARLFRRMRSPGGLRFPPHPQPAEVEAVLEFLRTFLRTGTPMDPIQLLRLRHQLGWSFQPFDLREKPGLAVEIRWRGKPAWIVWKKAKDHREPILGVFQPSRRASILTEICRNAPALHGKNWAVVEPLPNSSDPGSHERGVRRKWRGTPGFAAALPPVLRLARRQESGVLTIGDGLIHFDTADRTTILVLQSDLPPWARPGTDQDLTVALGAVLVLASLLFPAFCRWFVSWSLQWKLLCLVGYLVAMPLTASGLLALGYLNARQQSLDQQNLANSLTDLEVFDSSFIQYLRQVEIRLTRLHRLIAAGGPGTASLSRALDPLFQARIIDRLMLMNPQGEIVLDRTSPRRQTSLMNEVGASFLNGTLERERPETPRKPVSQRFLMFQDLIRNSIWGAHYLVEGTLQRFLHGAQIFYTYWRLFPPGHPTAGIMAGDLYHSHTAGYFLSRQRPTGNACRIYVWMPESGRWFPGIRAGGKDIEALADAANRRGELQTGILDLAAGLSLPGTFGESLGEPSLAVALPGIHLRGCVLVGLISPGDRDRILGSWKSMFGVGLLIALGLALASWEFLAQGLLVPVREILEGIGRLRVLETSRPIPVLANDELGRLSAGINRMMVLTDELDLARVVQRCFAPEHLPPFERFHLEFWEGQRLGVGGAFFDWYRNPDGTWTVILGSATGSGIRAALILAMVKALIVLHFREGQPPDRLLTRLGQELAALGPAQACMSLTQLLIDESSLRVGILAAGSPFTLVRQGLGGSARFVGSPSTPLGAPSPREAAPLTIVFSPGDSLLAFTHGVVQCPDPQGVPWGFDGLQAAFEAAGDAPEGTPRPALARLQEAFRRHSPTGGSGKEAFLLLSLPTSSGLGHVEGGNGGGPAA